MMFRLVYLVLQADQVHVPEAHAAAYVMMAYRIAWYKVFHPLAYYAAFFSIRATSFSYD